MNLTESNEDLFSQALLSEFEDWRLKIGKEASSQTFLSYLIRHNLIKPVTQRRFIILYEFHRIYPLHNFHKSRTVRTVAERLGFHENTVWNVLKKHNNEFDR